ncbi:hypothetical protein MTO96_009047 [Rhipicephalus appendiculatus]
MYLRPGVAVSLLPAASSHSVPVYRALLRPAVAVTTAVFPGRGGRRRGREALSIPSHARRVAALREKPDCIDPGPVGVVWAATALAAANALKQFAAATAVAAELRARARFLVHEN